MFLLHLISGDEYIFPFQAGFLLTEVLINKMYGRHTFSQTEIHSTYNIR